MENMSIDRLGPTSIELAKSRSEFEAMLYRWPSSRDPPLHHFFANVSNHIQRHVS
jgi:hypothetical protein